jgi:hypothetical protein
MATRPSAGHSPAAHRDAEDGDDNNMAVAGSASEELQDIEHRRDLRRKYRELREELADSADALGSVQEAETFAEKHVKINTLFKSVNNIRELGIDADTLNDLSKGVRSQASKLSDIPRVSISGCSRNLLQRNTQVRILETTSHGRN